MSPLLDLHPPKPPLVVDIGPYTRHLSAPPAAKSQLYWETRWPEVRLTQDDHDGHDDDDGDDDDDVWSWPFDFWIMF